MPEPNLEQVAPIISMLLFSFLDQIILLAYRVPHLSFDQLPPLPDYNFAKNLVKRGHPVSLYFRLVWYSVFMLHHRFLIHFSHATNAISSGTS